MQVPLISVIIPCHNSSSTITKTLKSVLFQHCVDINRVDINRIEIILIDDASSDSTISVIHKFFKKNEVTYKKVLVNKTNRGVSYSRNKGILAAKGKWIVFLDSDDVLNDYSFYYLDMIQKKQKKIDMISFGFYMQNANGVKKDYSAYNISNKTFKGYRFYKLFLSKKINIDICAIALRRTFVSKNNLNFSEGLKVAEDSEFIMSVLEMKPTTFYSSYHFFVYIISNNSATNGYNYFNYKMAYSIIALKNYFRKTNDKGNKANNINDYKRFYLVDYYVYNIKLLLQSKSFTEEAILLLMQEYKIMKLHIKPLNVKRFILISLVKCWPINAMLHWFLWRSRH